MALAILSFRRHWKMVWKRSLHRGLARQCTVSRQVYLGPRRAFVLFLSEEEQKTKWVDATWCLFEDSSLIQARHELTFFILVPFTPVVMVCATSPEGLSGHAYVCIFLEIAHIREESSYQPLGRKSPILGFSNLA